ncbi:family 16 glycoside hydrolase [Flagellimonas onchidii]|uniref:family 16 glycoside hydrolase n=1 Tax=Flagellimonas onchidii TaxID=2562684 RepID=UPI0010A684B3|nr:family 16 glycoside hydrolase [Allomuricauda onchidii]
MRYLSTMACFALLLLSVSSALSQNLIKNSSFENGDTSWQAKGDKMERHHQSILGARPYDGKYYAELASDSGYKLSQKVNVTPGQLYHISFYAQARPGVEVRESHFTFSAGTLQLKLQPKLGIWEQYVYTLRAAENTLTIAFEDTHYGHKGIGAMIDEVAVIPVSPEGFQSIFDGETLNGWKTYASETDKKKNYWKLENGTITGSTVGNKNHGAVWFFYEEELTDFELKLTFQTPRKLSGNGGVQVRSRYYEGGDIDGPQIDIHPPAPFRTGLLYDESDEYNRWLSPSLPDWNITPEQGKNRAAYYYADDTPEWNHLHVICKGSQITVILNGVVTTDYDGKGILDDAIHQKQNVGMKGKIGLQIHAGDEFHIRFRDILLKKLD